MKAFSWSLQQRLWTVVFVALVLTFCLVVPVMRGMLNGGQNQA